MEMQMMTSSWPLKDAARKKNRKMIKVLTSKGLLVIVDLYAGQPTPLQTFGAEHLEALFLAVAW